MLYATYCILSQLHKSSNTKSMTMEGIEDIDINSSQKIFNENEYTQIKSSINKMDAGDFWKLGVLQNFLETYKASPKSHFKLVYNMEIAKGNLSSLINEKVVSKFWVEKLMAHEPNIDYDDFFSKVSFDRRTGSDLHKDIISLLFKEWNVNKGTELQFLRSLFYNVLIWSKDRSTISFSDINTLFQDIRDSYSKASVNKAIENNWITKVSYERNENINSEDFYDGKAARPVHITLGLPARRKVWEKAIIENIIKSDVTIIKSSSGQGKSTLAWQTGYNLKEQNNYSIYQLHNCGDSNQANSVIEFLESRLLIGEMPLVIIDGLSSLVEAWTEVVEKTNDLTIKYLITTRQEDWYRFGADISRVNLMTIDIALSMSEAKDIFEQFKRNKKIHSDIIEWQPFWEQVANRNLLIEYTYLLTRGEMIHERLSAQLKYLHNDNTKSSGAKLEILRMVSLADCLNIKLKSKNLIDYIKKEIGFNQDRGEILNELEKEYFLSFEGRHIEGLHPVRSTHLKDLLHTNLPIEESLINLYKIIENEYKQDFFISMPLVQTAESKSPFYNSLAEILSEGPLSDMVTALDGIMHGEPQRYWNENKHQFDEAYKIGGIELFSMTSTPFTELNTLDEMTTILGDKGSNFKHLADLKKKLSTYRFDDSDVILFANALSKGLKARTSKITSLEGLEFLTKWFDSLKLPLNLPSIKSEIKIGELIQMDFNEAKEFMLFFQISNPSGYKDFTSQYKDLIISYLKVHTDSLTIKEINDQIHIEYLVFDNEASKVSELSVVRIETVYAFLPFYNKYCTEALMLPFPSEELIAVTKQDSIKKLSPQIVGNSFQIHLNQIWISAIRKQYQETSAYHWQNNIIEIRKTALEWSRSLTKFIDSLLEANINKKKQALSSIEKTRIQLNNLLTLSKKYPTYEKNYAETNNEIPEEKDINSWIASLTNINSQILNIFIPEKEHDRNLALINLKSFIFDLKEMQNAFTEIEKKTVAYFDSKTLCKEEDKCYERLYATVLYYLSQIPLENKIAIPAGRKAVEDWWSIAKNSKLNNLKDFLKIIEETLDYQFIYPDQLEETDTLTFCTFGIIDFDFSNSENVKNLVMTVSMLGELPCDFISIISVKNGIAISGLRFKRDFFTSIGNLITGDENTDLEGLAPLPIKIDEKAISMLPGVFISEDLYQNIEIENKIQILFDLWKLCEFRKNLDKNSVIEMDWLKRLNFESSIVKELNFLKGVTDDLKDFVNTGLQNDFIYTKEEIVVQIFKTLQNNTEN